MKLIVAVDKFWGIGKKNGLLFNLPPDMAFFRKKTLGKIVCMGYNTLLSFPNGKPLKNRINIVLAPESIVRDDCVIVHTLEALFKELAKYSTDEIFIIGGGMFYRTMYPYCDEAFITKVDADGKAEVFFDNLDEMQNWKREDLSGVEEYEGVKFVFTSYKNSSPKNF